MNLCKLKHQLSFGLCSVFLIEGNSKLVCMDALNGDSSNVNWNVSVVYSFCSSLFSFCCFRCVRREANGLVHALANMFPLLCLLCFVVIIPPFLALFGSLGCLEVGSASNSLVMKVSWFLVTKKKNSWDKIVNESP